MNKPRTRKASRTPIGRNWRHQAALERLEAREMLDASGHLISLRLEVTDIHGNPIQQVVQGETIEVTAYIEDRRGEPDVNVTPQPPNISASPFGFFTAYFNVTYDSVGFDFDQSFGVQFGPTINPVTPTVPNTSIDGYIERLGIQNIDLSGQLRPDEVELLSFRMIAEQPGVYDMEEGFLPHFHFDVVDRIEDPNQLPENWEVNYVDGVPQLERLTGDEFVAATVGADEYFSLYNFGQQPLTADSEVYFEGVDLTVISPIDADYEVRFVTSPTPTSGGEVNALPSNLDYLDEWSYFYVEVYAQAPAQNAVTGSTFTVNYDPNEFTFVRTVGRVEDPSNLRFALTSSNVDDANGKVTAGFSTLSTDLGDDRYALIGRVQLRSKIELPVNYNPGLQSITSSAISLSDTNTTVINTNSNVVALIGGTTPTGPGFDVWPVIYDTANGEDRRVGLADFAEFVEAFGKQVNGDAQVRKLDYDNNGSVGLSDFSLFVQNFGQSAFVESTRQNPAGYPNGLNTNSRSMGFNFFLEGEPIADKNTVVAGPPVPSQQEDSSSTEDSTVSDNLVGQPIVDIESTEFEADSEAPPSSESTTTTLVDDSTWNDQTDLSIFQSESWEDLANVSEEEDDFEENTDLAMAMWEEEELL